VILQFLVAWRNRAETNCPYRYLLRNGYDWIDDGEVCEGDRRHRNGAFCHRGCKFQRSAEWCEIVFMKALTDVRSGIGNARFVLGKAEDVLESTLAGFSGRCVGIVYPNPPVL
jgi:hypothetical protein